MHPLRLNFPWLTRVCGDYILKLHGLCLGCFPCTNSRIFDIILCSWLSGISQTKLMILSGADGFIAENSAIKCGLMYEKQCLLLAHSTYFVFSECVNMEQFKVGRLVKVIWKLTLFVCFFFLVKIPISYSYFVCCFPK